MTHYEIRSAKGRVVAAFDDAARAKAYRDARGLLKLRVFEVIRLEKEVA